MRERTVSRVGGKARPGLLLRSFGVAAFAGLFLFSSVANAYCSVDRGYAPVGIGLGSSSVALNAACAPAAPPSDENCEVPDQSFLQAPHIQSPGDMAAPVAQVVTYFYRGREPANASILRFPSRIPARSEPIFRRVPRLLI